MSRARDLSKLGNPNVIKADENSVGFGTQIAGNHANADSSLISAGIITATAFYGDGSNLEGVASAGLGTAVDDTKDSIGQNIYFTNQELSINENTTVNAPDTSNIAYTQYQQVTVESGSELIISDGDSFIPDVLGIGTALQASTAGAGNGLFGTIYVDNIENVAGRGGPNLPLGMTVSGVSTFSGNVSIGGTLTYEDVTNVDSIGIVTARNGIDITGGDLNAASTLILKTGGTEKLRIDSSGNMLGAGGQLRLKAAVGDSNGLKLYQGGSDTSYILNHYSGPLVLGTVNTERLRIGSAGQIGIAGANYGTSGQVMTSQGNAAAPQWADAGGGAWEVVSTHALSGSTSYIDSNGWSNSYAQYQVVFNDIYYSNTAFKIFLRIYKDATSGNAGTLIASSGYAYGSIYEEQWAGGAPQRSGSWGDAHKLGNNGNGIYYNGYQTFPMQTFNGGGNVSSSWYGRTIRGGDLFNTDGGMYTNTKDQFLTGIRMLFFATDGTTAISPSNGRVTILRMKYS